MLQINLLNAFTLLLSISILSLSRSLLFRKLNIWDGLVDNQTITAMTVVIESPQNVLLFKRFIFTEKRFLFVLPVFNRT